MEIVARASLKEAVNTIRTNEAGKDLLIVGIEDCHACRALKEDAGLIAEGLDLNRLILANLIINDNDELESIADLRLTDVPATYLFERGSVVGGWFGYDHDREQSFRTLALRTAISNKLALVAS